MRRIDVDGLAQPSLGDRIEPEGRVDRAEEFEERRRPVAAGVQPLGDLQCLGQLSRVRPCAGAVDAGG